MLSSSVLVSEVEPLLEHDSLREGKHSSPEVAAPNVQQRILDFVRTKITEEILHPSELYSREKEAKILDTSKRSSRFMRFTDPAILDLVGAYVEQVNARNVLRGGQGVSLSSSPSSTASARKSTMKYIFTRKDVTYIRYDKGDFFTPHEDYLSLTTNFVEEWTGLMCVGASDDLLGGETVFHLHDGHHPQSDEDNEGEQARGKLVSRATVSPKSAVFFRKDLTHEGAAVERGVKEVIMFDLWAVPSGSDRHGAPWSSNITGQDSAKVYPDPRRVGEGAATAPKEHLVATSKEHALASSRRAVAKVDVIALSLLRARRKPHNLASPTTGKKADDPSCLTAAADVEILSDSGNHAVVHEHHGDHLTLVPYASVMSMSRTLRIIVEKCLEGSSDAEISAAAGVTVITGREETSSKPNTGDTKRLHQDGTFGRFFRCVRIKGQNNSEEEKSEGATTPGVLYVQLEYHDDHEGPSTSVSNYSTKTSPRLYDRHSPSASKGKATSRTPLEVLERVFNRCYISNEDFLENETLILKGLAIPQSCLLVEVVYPEHLLTLKKPGGSSLAGGGGPIPVYKKETDKKRSCSRENSPPLRKEEEETEVDVGERASSENGSNTWSRGTVEADQKRMAEKNQWHTFADQRVLGKNFFCTSSDLFNTAASRASHSGAYRLHFNAIAKEDIIALETPEKTAFLANIVRQHELPFLSFHVIMAEGAFAQHNDTQNPGLWLSTMCPIYAAFGDCFHIMNRMGLLGMKHRPGRPVYNHERDRSWRKIRNLIKQDRKEGYPHIGPASPIRDYASIVRTILMLRVGFVTEGWSLFLVLGASDSKQSRPVYSPNADHSSDDEAASCNKLHSRERSYDYTRRDFVKALGGRPKYARQRMLEPKQSWELKNAAESGKWPISFEKKGGRTFLKDKKQRSQIRTKLEQMQFFERLKERLKTTNFVYPQRKQSFATSFCNEIHFANLNLILMTGFIRVDDDCDSSTWSNIVVGPAPAPAKESLNLKGTNGDLSNMNTSTTISPKKNESGFLKFSPDSRVEGGGRRGLLSESRQEQVDAEDARSGAKIQNEDIGVQLFARLTRLSGDAIEVPLLPKASSCGVPSSSSSLEQALGTEDSSTSAAKEVATTTIKQVLQNDKVPIAQLERWVAQEKKISYADLRKLVYVALNAQRGLVVLSEAGFFEPVINKQPIEDNTRQGLAQLFKPKKVNTSRKHRLKRKVLEQAGPGRNVSPLRQPREHPPHHPWSLFQGQKGARDGLRDATRQL
ncbi:unnamed protein product [Amoebophrya sp. A25]|nr:unnamed protein product [Amoebophrya sp. A25]|eukprot:GSA25T00018242001.1